MEFFILMAVWLAQLAFGIWVAWVVIAIAFKLLTMWARS
jgi:hypothetical protein